MRKKFIKKYNTGGEETNYDKLAAAILQQLKLNQTGSISPVKKGEEDITYEEGYKGIKPIGFYDFDNNIKQALNKQKTSISQIRQLDDKTFQYDVDKEIGKIDNPFFQALNPLVQGTTYLANNINDMKQRKRERKQYYLNSRQGSFNLNESGLNNIPMFPDGGINKPERILPMATVVGKKRHPQPATFGEFPTVDVDGTKVFFSPEKNEFYLPNEIKDMNVLNDLINKISIRHAKEGSKIIKRRNFKKGGKNDNKKEEPIKKENEDFYYYTRDPKAVPKGAWQYEVGKLEDASQGSFGEQLRMLAENEMGRLNSFAGTVYEQNAYTPPSGTYLEDAKGNPKYLLKERNINFYNSDQNIQDFIRQRAAQNMQNVDPNLQFKVIGEQTGNSGFVDVSPYNIDQQFRLWDYEENPDYRSPFDVATPDLSRHLRVPTLIPNIPTPAPKVVPRKPKVTPRPEPEQILRPMPVMTRDNTMTQQNELRAANGQPLPVFIQEKIAEDNRKRSQQSGTVNIFDKDGNVIGQRPANWYNGQYSQDRLNYGDGENYMGPVEEIAVDLALLAAAGPLGNVASRLGSAAARYGMKGKNAEKLYTYVQRVLTSGKNPKSLQYDKEYMKLLKEALPQKRLPAPKIPKQLQGRPAFDPTGPSGKWLPGIGGFKTGGTNKYNVGDIVDLSPDEIAELLRNGYDFEIE